MIAAVAGLCCHVAKCTKIVARARGIGAAVGPCVTYVCCTYYILLHLSFLYYVGSESSLDRIGPPDQTGPAMASGSMVRSEAI
jgi:hypothetical protein